MRRCRISLPNRCYHLISRVAHRAYFLDEDERTRLVDFVRRVAEFSGVKLLAYSVMSNHFHVFVYIGRPESLSDAEIVRRISALYSDVRSQAYAASSVGAEVAGISAHDAWYREPGVLHEGVSPSADGGGVD